MTHTNQEFKFIGELYHELHALDRYEQDYRRKLQEELIPASKQGSNLLNHKEVLNGSLGVAGLALHYANITNQIDNIVSRPLSLPPTIRDSLYQGLPIRVKASLRARLQSSFLQKVESATLAAPHDRPHIYNPRSRKSHHSSEQPSAMYSSSDINGLVSYPVVDV